MFLLMSQALQVPSQQGGGAREGKREGERQRVGARERVREGEREGGREERVQRGRVTWGTCEASECYDNMNQAPEQCPLCVLST